MEKFYSRKELGELSVDLCRFKKSFDRFRG
jgi:hypothetical protein